MNERTCIVTRQSAPAADLIRFVAGPDGVIVPDLRARLPGRGAWVSASSRQIDEAVRRKAFARALRTQVKVPADLADQVDGLLERRALEALGLVAGAGAILTGFTKVERGLGNGSVAKVLTAVDAAPDSVRKMTALMRAHSLEEDGPIQIFTNDQMSLALGQPNVIHAGVAPGRASASLEAAIGRLERYRDGTADRAGAA